MTLGSQFEGLKPSIATYKPTIDISTTPADYDPYGTFVNEVSDSVSGYSHTVKAMGGFWSASFSLKDTKSKIENWIETGLGRHVDVKDRALNVIWQGFVNRITAQIGPLTVVRGPLLDVTNESRVIYSTVDTSTVPPIMGIRARTESLSDDDSRAQYGTFVSFLSAGGMTQTGALEVRNQWLQEKAYPKTTQSFTLGAAATPSIQVECLGYVHFMNKYIFNNTTGAAGTIDADARIDEILAAESNRLLWTSYNELDSNTVQVPDYTFSDQKGFDAIKSVVALGDASDNRWLFGVYAGSIGIGPICKYYQAPGYTSTDTGVAYFQNLADQGQEIYDRGGEEVLPWLVEPGNWLIFNDLMVGRVTPSILYLDRLRQDPRAMFIESASFTAPWSLQLQGGNTDTINQKLAKMGLAGVGS